MKRMIGDNMGFVLSFSLFSGQLLGVKREMWVSSLYGTMELIAVQLSY
jgi:hypothetical protein